MPDLSRNSTHALEVYTAPVRASFVTATDPIKQPNPIPDADRTSRGYCVDAAVG